MSSPSNAVREGTHAPPRAAIVSVGNELLYGQTLDTNAAWLGRTLAEWGMEVVAGFTVRDRSPEIRAALQRAMASAEVVVVSGGLGPTADDVTKSAVAEELGVGLVVDPNVREAVEARFRARGYDGTPPLSEGQSEILAGSRALANERGTAPGILLEREGVTVVLVPGVPAEMRGIVSGPLREAWEARGLVGQAVRHRVLHTTGIPESRLAELVEPLWNALPGHVRDRVGLAFLPDELGVDLRLSVPGSSRERAEALFSEVELGLDPAIREWRFDSRSGDLAESVSDELLRAGLTLASAESCTGGLVAKRMTDRAGASDVFVGAVVAYDNEVKVAQLGVSRADLERDGAVSEAVALQMATGVRARLGADVGVSITGVAGPGGGSPEKPAGTVWIGVALEGASWASRNRFPGGRRSVRRRSAQAALAEVYRSLVDSRGGA